MHPGVFVLSNARLSQVEGIREKAAHDEEIRLFCECNGVKDTLRNKLVKAMLAVYFDALRDPTTDLVSKKIPDMIKIPLKELLSFESRRDKLT